MNVQIKILNEFFLNNFQGRNKIRENKNIKKSLFH